MPSGDHAGSLSSAAVLRQVAHLRAVVVHEIDFLVAIAVGLEGDPRAIRRPGGRSIPDRRIGFRQMARRAAREVQRCRGRSCRRGTSGKRSPRPLGDQTVRGRRHQRRSDRSDARCRRRPSRNMSAQRKPPRTELKKHPRAIRRPVGFVVFAERCASGWFRHRPRSTNKSQSPPQFATNKRYAVHPVTSPGCRCPPRR